MSSVMAIVSKAVFEPLAKQHGGAAPGTRLPLDRYTSTHKTLATLADGGSLFLVTVRPPDEQLWLVGVLDAPELRKDGWHARANTRPIADVSALVGKLALANGKGITAAKGALAMSLQTPRVLADTDVALLRGAAGVKPAKETSTTKPAKAAATTKPAKAAATTKPAKGSTTTKPARARTTKPAKARTTKPAPATAATAKAVTAAKAASSASTATSAAGRVTAATARSASAVNLDAIAAAIEVDDGAAALAAALEGWRTTRAPALAELVGAISARISGPPVADHAAWSQLADAPDPLAIGRLLPAIPELPVSFLPTAAQRLAAFPEDPRIAHAFATWAVDPITTSSSTYPFWTRGLELVVRARDVRALPLIARRLKMKPEGSQFWARFYTALAKARAQLAAVQPLAVDEARIAKLAKAAAKLTVVTPAPARPRVAASAPTLDGPPLAQAVAHAEAGRVQAALDALLEAWRALGKPPALADAIDRATRLLPAWDRALGSVGDVPSAWLAAFAADPMAAMPQLLENVNAGGAAPAERALAKLATLPDDPRVAMRLVELCSVSGISPERTHYWRTLLELIARTADVRTAPYLRAAFRDFTGRYYDHHRQARRLVGTWALEPPAPPQLGPTETRHLAALARALAQLEAARDRTEEQLVRAIADAWEDPGPRLVYADWLIEREHPRGELILLASKPAPTPGEAARLREVRRHGQLLGPLDDLGASWQEDRGLGLERGLPTTLPVRHTGHSPIWRKLAGYPLLACIGEIAFAAAASPPPPEDLARVIVDPLAVRLAHVRGVPAEYLRLLAPAVAPRFVVRGNDLVRA